MEGGDRNIVYTDNIIYICILKHRVFYKNTYQIHVHNTIFTSTPGSVIMMFSLDHLDLNSLPFTFYLLTDYVNVISWVKFWSAEEVSAIDKL